MASILMLGLESDLANELTRVLAADGHDVETVETTREAAGSRHANVIFAGGDGPDYRETVAQLTETCNTPVVLVNRLPENTRWLDALELGAADYCGAPFEPRQVRWLIDSVLRQPAAA